MRAHDVCSRYRSHAIRRPLFPYWSARSRVVAYGSADGTGAAARFSGPSGVAVNRGREVYVADTGKLYDSPDHTRGVVTTLAGSAGIVGSADGTGAAARFAVRQRGG